jgi:hypothetical protein
MGRFTDIALQSDGSILATDGTRVARYTSTGEIDTTFGFNGKSDTLFFGESSFPIDSLDVRGDDSIYLGGRQYNTMSVARLNKNGQIDETFGQGGVAISGVPSTGFVVVNHDAAGNALVNGTTFMVGNGLDYSSARFYGGCP